VKAVDGRDPDAPAAEESWWEPWEQEPPSSSPCRRCSPHCSCRWSPTRRRAGRDGRRADLTVKLTRGPW